VARHLKDPGVLERAEELVRKEVNRIYPKVQQYRKALQGRRAAIYVGGSFKAFSLVKALRHIGIQTAIVGSQTGSSEDYQYLKEICDEGTVIVDDTNPLELSRFMMEKEVDLLIGGVKERPIAYKMGVAFCDHNHERKIALAGFEGMLNFCEEVRASILSPVWQFSPARQKRIAMSEVNDYGRKSIAI
jgi:nitrogenase molybdenum-cofactor synthesis protein NifE